MHIFSAGSVRRAVRTRPQPPQRQPRHAATPCRQGRTTSCITDRPAQAAGEGSGGRGRGLWTGCGRSYSQTPTQTASGRFSGCGGARLVRLPAPQPALLSLPVLLSLLSDVLRGWAAQDDAQAGQGEGAEGCAAAGSDDLVWTAPAAGPSEGAQDRQGGGSGDAPGRRDRETDRSDQGAGADDDGDDEREARRFTCK